MATVLVGLTGGLLFARARQMALTLSEAAIHNAHQRGGLAAPGIVASQDS